MTVILVMMIMIAIAMKIQPEIQTFSHSKKNSIIVINLIMMMIMKIILLFILYYIILFLDQALSTKDGCDSDWSAPLPIVCPGAWQPQISRVPSSHVNSIHVTWVTPRLFGGATVENYKVGH